jgi:hypothetical protein
MISDIIENIQIKQQKNYDFIEIPYLLNVLSNDIFIDLYNDDIAWGLSKKIEP